MIAEPTDRLVGACAEGCVKAIVLVISPASVRKQQEILCL